MPERVIFQAGDADDEDQKPDPDAIRIKRGKQLVTVGVIIMCMALLMVLLFILLVAGVVPTPSSKNCKAVDSPKNSRVSTSFVLFSFFLHCA
jgi:hypothetical protein